MLMVTKRDSVSAACAVSTPETSPSRKSASWSGPQRPGAAPLPGSRSARRVPGSRSPGRWQGAPFGFLHLRECEKSVMCLNVMFLPCRQVNNFLSTFPMFFQWMASSKDSLKAFITFTLDPKPELRNSAFFQHCCPVYS